MQTWQGKSLTKDSTKTSVLYQGNLSKHMNSKESDFAKQGLTKPHQLRALYVQYVLKMFDWGTARDVRVAKYVLDTSPRIQATAMIMCDLQMTN